MNNSKRRRLAKEASRLEIPQVVKDKRWAAILLSDGSNRADRRAAKSKRARRNNKVA